MKDKNRLLTKAVFLFIILLVILAGLYIGQQIKAKEASVVEGPNIVYVLQLMLTGDNKWQSLQAKGFSNYGNRQQFDLCLEVIQRSNAGNYIARAETSDKPGSPA